MHEKVLKTVLNSVTHCVTHYTLHTTQCVTHFPTTQVCNTPRCVLHTCVTQCVFLLCMRACHVHHAHRVCARLPCSVSMRVRPPLAERTSLGQWVLTRLLEPVTTELQQTRRSAPVRPCRSSRSLYVTSNTRLSESRAPPTEGEFGPQRGAHWGARTCLSTRTALSDPS